MTKIKTFQDGTSMGTFSQIDLDDGNKILISLTQTEIAIFKVGFLGMPKGNLWKADIFKFIDAQKGDSTKTERSVLEIAVDIAISCKTINEVVDTFSKCLTD